MALHTWKFLFVIVVTGNLRCNAAPSDELWSRHLSQFGIEITRKLLIASPPSSHFSSSFFTEQPFLALSSSCNLSWNDGSNEPRAPYLYTQRYSIFNNGLDSFALHRFPLRFIWWLNGFRFSHPLQSRSGILVEARATFCAWKIARRKENPRSLAPRFWRLKQTRFTNTFSVGITNKAKSFFLCCFTAIKHENAERNREGKSFFFPDHRAVRICRCMDQPIIVCWWMWLELVSLHSFLLFFQLQRLSMPSHSVQRAISRARRKKEKSFSIQSVIFA